MSPVDLRARHHAALETIVLFDYRLTCRTGLHIGAGKSADLAGSDLPVLRDAKGQPLVPGSSLRGILRSGVESFCKALDLDAVLQHDTGQTDEAEAVSAAFATGWRGLKLAERLFGAAADKPGGFSYGSRLQISDALACDDVAVELRDGVGIDRDTRTAAGGVKFDLEVVPAGTAFDGHVRFKNPAGHEIGLLAQALWMLDQGLLLLGGKSARGLGWMQVEVTAPRRLDAETILKRVPRAAASGFGTVEDHLGDELAALQELAEQAAAARA
ncbi:MAG TPA: CRISPR-associated RAMP protein Csx7 [Thermoanaerobaculia bacterium]|jgi:CRISPR-associated RAMP protein (TIGR02581 family)|nr:CRISPR-associated RAMP protein Csx7 [Thermoanaerobaculia bacterium]